MKKVLHILQMDGVGGVQELVSSLALKTSLAGIKTSIFTFRGANTQYIDIFMQNNISVFVSPYKVNDIRNICLLSKNIRSLGVEIVQVHNTYPQLYCSILLGIFFPSVKGIVTEHAIDSKRRHYPILRLLDELTYLPYSKIVSVSEPVSEKIQSWLKHLKPERFITINNGVDIRRFINARPIDRRTLGINPNDYIIISVGRIVREKGYMTIIRAISKLPSIYKLLIVGDGPQRHELEEFVSQNNLVDRVIFVGFQRDVAPFMKSSNLYVSASITEGFGLTIIEASAAGLPVLGSNIPAFRKLLPADQLFEIYDSSGLADMISQRRSKCMIEHYQNYTLEAMVCSYILLYNSISVRRNTL